MDKTGTKIKKAQSGPPPMREGQEYINPGNDDQMEIHGFRRSILKTIVVWFFIFITVGLLRLFFYWLPQLFIKATHTKSSLSAAKIVALKDQYKQWFVTPVKIITMEEGITGITTHKLKNKGILDRGFTKPGSSAQQLMETDTVRYFVTKKVKYIWSEDTLTFEKAKGLVDTSGCSYFHEVDGLSAQEQSKRRVWYGTNTIPVHVTPVMKLIFTQIISPFYVFQVFSCTLWYFDEYYYYATCIVLMSIISITAYIYQTRKMQRALRNTIGVSTVVTVCRGEGVYEDISSEDLAPGDVLEIPRHGCVMQCDAVLVAGNCIVNESMLTGESVPATKTPLPNPRVAKTEDTPFDIKHQARHVLFCGTKVIQTRFYGNQRVRAVVVRTGFSTAKGNLVRSILYPKPVDFRFKRDTYIFVAVLAGIAFLGFIYTIVLMVIDEDDASDIVLRSLDLITIAVPPALPAALTIGIVFAQNRLKAKSIYCISPHSINLSGTVNVFCFDKTGTLTEDGLNMQCVHTADDGRFVSQNRDISNLPYGPTMIAMATCHSLTIIDNIISGDPLDLIMFESTGWELEEPGEEHNRYDMICPTVVRPKPLPDLIHSADSKQVPLEEVGIVRQFTFSSTLQRMSVVTRQLNGKRFDLYTKGAPEKIASLSRPETVPSNFHDILMMYTRHGYRVLGLAWRSLPEKLNYTKIQRIQREQVENNLTFLGLLVMENRVKPQTTPVINLLNQASIRTVMVTGDNILTAMSVARECEMVQKSDNLILVQAVPPHDAVTDASIEFMYADDNRQEVKEVVKKSVGNELRIDIPDTYTGTFFHFAIDGKSWEVLRKYFPDLLPKLVLRGTVFARMSPDQKTQLVEALQRLGYYVGMCGDGANDCGALKTAHAGISLSEAEASVASPFTSKKPDIECVPNLIGEGRAALVTSVGVFKFMACYSLTQFVSVCLLYWIGNNLTDFQFLYIDLGILTTLSITFGRTEGLKKLAPNPPLVNMFSIGPILSLVSQTVIVIAAQVFCYFNVQQQSWFVKYEENEDDDYASYENMSVFLVSAYQYITLVVVFSKGAPYRKMFFTNYWFVGNLVLCIGITLWLTIYPTDGFAEFMELKVAPVVTYRLLFIGIAALNFFVSLLAEMFFADSKWVSFELQRKIERCFRRPDYHYNVLEEEIKDTPHWPPISKSTDSLAQIFERLDSLQTVEIDQASLHGSLMDDSDEDNNGKQDFVARPTDWNDANEKSQLTTDQSFTNPAFFSDIDDVQNSDKTITKL